MIPFKSTHGACLSVPPLLTASAAALGLPTVISSWGCCRSFLLVAQSLCLLPVSHLPTWQAECRCKRQLVYVALLSPHNSFKAQVLMVTKEALSDPAPCPPLPGPLAGQQTPALASL